MKRNQPRLLIPVALCLINLVAGSFIVKPDRLTPSATSLTSTSPNKKAGISKPFAPTPVPNWIAVERFGGANPTITDIYVSGTIGGVPVTTHYLQNPTDTWKINNAAYYDPSNWTLFVTVSVNSGLFAYMTCDLGASPYYQCRNNAATSGSHVYKFYRDVNNENGPGQKIRFFATGSCPP